MFFTIRWGLAGLLIGALTPLAQAFMRCGNARIDDGRLVEIRTERG